MSAAAEGRALSDEIRVCHVISGLQTGGAETMLLKLVVALAERGVRSEVVSLRDSNAMGPLIEATGTPVHCLGLFGVGDLAPAAVRLVRTLRRVRPHVVQGWMYHGNLAASLGAVLAGRRVTLWGIRQTLYDLSQEKPGTATAIRLGARVSRRHPDRVLYNSRAAAREHEAMGYDASKTVVIPNGFDCEVLRPDPLARANVIHRTGLEDTATIVGMVARYHPVKNHKGFLRAAAIAVRERPELRFVLVGPGMEESNPELMRDVRDAALGNRLVLLGHDADAARLAAGFDFATLTSWGESFPNVIGEAMACGVPCVVTDVGDAAWIVGDSGTTVPAGDTGALVAAWVAMCDLGQAGRAVLGARARQRIEAEFSMQRIAREYHSLYMDELRRSGRTN